MSDDTADNTENNSLFSNLVNKVKYKAHTVAYDPQANEFAKQQAAKRRLKKSLNNLHLLIILRIHKRMIQINLTAKDF